MIDVRNLSVRYAGRSEKTLTDVHLRVSAGELALLCGPTGCGKSTLLHCLNGILLHESSAEVEGEILLDGRDARQTPLREICRFTGSVFQNPESQICTATVETEVAFGLENMALPRHEMRERIAEALETVGMTAQRGNATATLSGGQKQRLAIACALALRPRVLLLDEPVSQVDSESAGEILDVIARLKERHECAVLLIEHRLDETARLADRIILMREGRIVFDRPRDAALTDLEPLRSAGIALPHLPDLFARLGRKERPLSAEEAPLLALREETVPGSEEISQKTDAKGEKEDARREKKDARREKEDAKREKEDARREKEDAKREKEDAKRGKQYGPPHSELELYPSPRGRGAGVRADSLHAAPGVDFSEVVCAVRNLGFRYSKAGPMVLEGLNIAFRRGDRVALMGPNGSGKTTLLHLLAGLLKPTSGRIEWFLPEETGAERRKRPVFASPASSTSSDVSDLSDSSDLSDLSDSSELSDPSAPSAVGLVLQEPDLMLFQETVGDEVAFAPRQRRFTAHAREEISRDVLARLGLSELREEAPFALSRGQRVRTALASVLSMRPRVLLLDEPTAGQDREQIERLMTTLAEGFDLVIFCTHDADTAARHGNRVAVLGERGILRDGPPREALFEAKTRERGRIRQTGAQAYAFRAGARALTVEELANLLDASNGSEKSEDNKIIE